MSTFKVLTDSTYTGGLAWLHRFSDEIESEPTAEFEPSVTKDGVMNEYYIVRFPDSLDGSSLLDQCDAVLSYEKA